MYLYEKTTTEINIYTLVANNEKVRKLKRKELSTIPLETGAYKLQTKNGKSAQTFDGSTSLKYNEIKKAISYQSTGQTQQVREKYIENDFNIGMPKVINCEKDNIYLFTSGLIQRRKQNTLFRRDTIYTIDDILIITRKLYLLHSFLRRDFFKLTEEDINDFVKACDFSHNPIESIPLSSKDELLTEERLKIDAKILEKISR